MDDFDKQPAGAAGCGGGSGVDGHKEPLRIDSAPGQPNGRSAEALARARDVLADPDVYQRHQLAVLDVAKA
ncbi:MAG: hypothetical protein JSS43_15605 [Proteobacteria bacterium]|nr:hypothetical protein [Pseudomonadota bacterium]